MSSQVRDMTKGNTTKLLLEFSIPMLVGNIFQQVYNLADSIIVGKVIGSDALAAVGATGSLSFLFFSFCIGVANGSGIVSSKYFGAKDRDNVKRVIANGAYIMLLASLIMAVVGYVLSMPVLRLLNTPAEVIDTSAMYLRMMCLGIPLVGIYNYGAALLRSLGDSRTPLVFLIVSCFINIGLDLFFVLCLGMGVFGAALATVIAQMISGAGCLVYSYVTNEYFRIEKDLMRVSFKTIKECVRMGSMMALQMSMIAVSCIVLQRYVNGFGPVTMAAFTAAGRIEQIVQQPYQSLGMAISTHAGQNLGAGKHARIREGFAKGMKIVALFSLIMLPIAQFFGSDIMHIFVNDEAVIAQGATALRTTSLFYFALGGIYVSRGIMNGIGDASFAFLNGAVEMFGRIVFPAVLIGMTPLGVQGLWLSAGLTWFISGLLAVIRYFDVVSIRDFGRVRRRVWLERRRQDKAAKAIHG